MSFSVNDWRANGAGFVGNGCVGDEYSPGTSDCGTLRSSIGQIGVRSCARTRRGTRASSPAPRCRCSGCSDESSGASAPAAGRSPTGRDARAAGARSAGRSAHRSPRASCRTGCRPAIAAVEVEARAAKVDERDAALSSTVDSLQLCTPPDSCTPPPARCRRRTRPHAESRGTPTATCRSPRRTPARRPGASYSHRPAAT